MGGVEDAGDGAGALGADGGVGATFFGFISHAGVGGGSVPGSRFVTMGGAGVEVSGFGGGAPATASAVRGHKDIVGAAGVTAGFLGNLYLVYCC